MASRALRSLVIGLGLTGAILHGSAQARPATTDAEFDRQRQTFIERHLHMIGDERVKAAFEKVRREQYCLPEHRDAAYEDRPLPIGLGQTISQPSLVAYMTEVLELGRGEKVLEIGTGSGFQAAVLAEMGAEVFTIELIDELARRAAATLHAEGYRDVQVRSGDGYLGWPEEAPFDAIIVTAAPERVPPALLEQLKPGTGRLLVPEGPQSRSGQTLKLYTKDAQGRIASKSLLPVRFVPMVPGPGRTE